MRLTPSVAGSDAFQPLVTNNSVASVISLEYLERLDLKVDQRLMIINQSLYKKYKANIETRYISIFFQFLSYIRVSMKEICVYS